MRLLIDPTIRQLDFVALGARQPGLGSVPPPSSQLLLVLQGALMIVLYGNRQLPLILDPIARLPLGEF